MSDAVNSSNKRNLLLLLAVFVLPIVLAKFALQFDWFDKGVTNKGQLISGEQTVAELGIDSSQFPEQWLLIYRIPENCAEACQNSLLTVNNAYQLLGKEIPRVTPIALTSPNQPQSEQLKHQKWQVLSEPLDKHTTMTQGTLIVADPLGNQVLLHKVPLEQEALSLFGKSLIADMKKLLKYSKVG